MTMHVGRDYHSMSCAVKKISGSWYHWKTWLCISEPALRWSQWKVIKNTMKLTQLEASLMVRWLRFHSPNAGGLGSIPGQGTRSHMLQGRLRIPCAEAKTWSSQPNFLKFCKIHVFYKKEVKVRLLLFSCSVMSHSFATPWTIGSSIHGISQARILTQV